jgi:hypothetical protein
MNNILSTRIGRVTAASALIGASVLGVATGVAAADPASERQNASVNALAAAPEVFAGFDNLDQLSGTNPRVNTVNLPAGQYSIVAKGFITNSNNDNSAVQCQLTAGSDFDRSETSVRVSAQSTALAVVHKSTTPFAATLSCANVAASSNTSMSFIKIVATRVNSVTNNSM